MAHWRVDYIGKGEKHLGTVEAPDERSASLEAFKMFHITPSRRFKVVVTKIETKREYKSPEPRCGRGISYAICK